MLYFFFFFLNPNTNLFSNFNLLSNFKFDSSYLSTFRIDKIEEITKEEQKIRRTRENQRECRWIDDDKYTVVYEWWTIRDACANNA